MFRLATTASPRAARTARVAERVIRKRVAQRRPRPARVDGFHLAFGEQLFLHSRDAVVVIDLYSNQILRWNPAAEELLGYSAAEVVGRSIEMLMPPAVARLHREQLVQYLRSGDPGVLLERRPLATPMLHKSGTEVSVEISSAPLTAPGLLSGSVLMLLRDRVCEQRAEQKTVEAAQAVASRVDAERKLECCRDLLRQTTHEFERPVKRARRSAARLARLARRTDGGDSRRLALLARVVELRADDLHHSLEEMDLFTAIETGDFKLERERVNLVPLLGRIVANCQAQRTSHRLKFAAPQGLTAVADADRLQLVIQDLLERAMRRNPRGCWIDVDLRRPLAGLARIEVRDYGRPLSARERQMLSAPPNGDHGWHVNRHIVAGHGGTLEVESPREGGVRVVITLPTNRPRGTQQ